MGFKYQMTDISAALGLAALQEWEGVREHRRALFAIYERGLTNVPGVTFVGGGLGDRVHAAWLCTIFAKNRIGLQRKLRDNRIESNQVHYRNDRYTLFKDSRGSFPNMDAIEDEYLVLPLHTRMTAADAQRVVGVIKSGW
jgi:dTDP-4-amino-4,6-dideoxygalactose transaminase